MDGAQAAIQEAANRKKNKKKRGDGLGVDR